MALPFLGNRPRDFMIQPLVREDAGALSRLHQEDFVRPWNEAEFAGLLEQRTVFGYAARQAGHGREGFGGGCQTRTPLTPT